MTTTSENCYSNEGKRVQIKGLKLKNYCNFTDFSVEFGNKTVIQGKNKSGKSTIKRAILDCLELESENCKKISDIRPISDAKNELSIERELTVSIGEEIVNFKKITKKIGGIETTEHYINNVLYKKKDYDGYINNNISTISNLNVAFNGKGLFKMAADEEREFIVSFFRKSKTEFQLPASDDLTKIELDYLKSGNYATALRKQIKFFGEKSKEIPARIDEIEILSEKLGNLEILESRKEELKASLKAYSQESVNIEKIKNRLDNFMLMEAESLQNSVNSAFKMAQFKLFEKVDGEYKSTCEVSVSGVNYATNLNHSDKILAEIEVSKVVQEKLGLCLPILIDDAECIDSNRIPAMENQLIIFKRANGNLKIVKEM